MEVVGGNTSYIEVSGGPVDVKEVYPLSLGDFLKTEYGDLKAIGVVTEISFTPLTSGKPRFLGVESEVELRKAYPDLKMFYDVLIRVKILGFFRGGRVFQGRLPSPPPIHNIVELASGEEVKNFHGLSSDLKVNYTVYFERNEYDVLLLIMEKLAEMGVDRKKLTSKIYNLFRVFKSEDEANLLIEFLGW